MKKFLTITGIISLVLLMAACGGPRRNPGRVYMPDMAYSRAYETYAELDSNKFTNDTLELGEGKIFYNSMPVGGTIARGEMLYIYPHKNDSAGYANSADITNPFKADSIDLKEAERLYLVNCGICHGAKLDGNGPLWKDGAGPYPAAPKNLMGDDMKSMKDGTMFHSVTYGKGQMGSYASQLSTKQRWEVIAFIKAKQGGGAVMKDSAVAKTPAVDTMMKKGK